MLNLKAKPSVFIEGFVSLEGPAFTANGVLYFCDFGVFPGTGDPAEQKARNIYRATQSKHVEVFVNTGGMPTGAAFHRDGRLFVCDSGRQELLAIDPSGRISVLAREYRGERLHGPNDLVFDPCGNLYFTDPKGSSLEKRIGNVYLYRTNGELERLDEGYAFPNGVAIGPDGKTLYMAETHTRRIYRFSLGPDGRFTGREVFAELSGDDLIPGAGPDGMAFDVEGNLYVAYWGKGCVSVLDQKGRLVGELPTLGKKPTNVAFWGTVLYVTEMEPGRIVCLDVGIPGLRLFGMS